MNVSNTSNCHGGGWKWKHLFGHPAWVQTLMRTMGNYRNRQFWHGSSCRRSQKQMSIEHCTFSGMLVSNTIYLLSFILQSSNFCNFPLHWTDNVGLPVIKYLFPLSTTGDRTLYCWWFLFSGTEVSISQWRFIVAFSFSGLTSNHGYMTVPCVLMVRWH